MTTEQFIRADEFHELQREHAALKELHARLHKATSEVQMKSYNEGREDARREYVRLGSLVEQGDGLAHLTLPDKGGAIQFAIVGAHGPRPITGGVLTPDPDLSLRIWGPPDEDGSYGVHEQGGGNLTDFSMTFDLTPAGMVIHSMDVRGVRTRWDRGER